ncbi:hypothetical protein [Streptomyces sp. HB132]|uniref:hypothetical protein n=1 Tax=Streptomyces sp. HB132 TaxID=767388 RepID=UPI001E05D50F|nr:hypothetical protein [Streptomyces sp. HB132]MBM7438691.1 hypothetical protein [Streptomyces sp. HB132]
MRGTRRGTAAVAVVAAGFMTVTAGCGLTDESEGAPAPSPEPTPAFTTQTVADEIAGLALAGGLPEGDTSTAGLPKGAWRTCVAPWTGDAPAAGAADAFEATVMRLRQHDWEIVSSHAEQEITYRTLAKRGWKLYARHYTGEGAGAGQTVALTAVEDGCRLPKRVRGDYEDPA